MRMKWKAAFLVLTIALSQQALSAEPGSWVIRNEAWSPVDEKNFSRFVALLGESGCRTVDACLKNPANPYRSSDAARVTFRADCADWPFVLRAYFAWKNALPFSYANGVLAVEGRGGDIRYSPQGNRVVSRRDIVQTSSKNPPQAMTEIVRMQNQISSAMFRYDPRTDAKTAFFPDFYPAAIDRANIRPGTLIYDPNGHVAVVYRVEKDGRVRFFDAHPDNSITRGVYGEKFARSKPGMGAGFKNWRPLRLVNATRASTGEWIGGQIRALTNAELPGYSLVQFFGTHPVEGSWSRGKFIFGNHFLGYYDFIRASLSVGDLRYQPVEELANMMDALCDDLRDRVTAVQTSVDARIDQKDHPRSLPLNIYGSFGEWETYSSPSRDARLKTSFHELRTRIQQFVTLYRQGSPLIRYEGNDLIEDLSKTHEQRGQACIIRYVKSDGSRVSLTFAEASERLFAFSFDPYDCPELRWGATEPAELSSCRNSPQKWRWYEAEQGLRNQLERNYEARMGFTVDQLEAGGPGTGVPHPPDVDLKAYLDHVRSDAGF